MRISFILPGVPHSPSGGKKILLEYANRLAMLGNDVCVYFACDLTLGFMARYGFPKKVHQLAMLFLGRLSPRWFQMRSEVKKKTIFTIDGSTIRNGDIVIASSAPTALPTFKLPCSCGRKFYFIQGIETWEMDSDSLAETYALGMRNITVSSWLKSVVDNSSQSESILLVNPIDCSTFFQEDVEREDLLVSVMYHDADFKGFPDAYKALMIVKRFIPGLRVSVFGVSNRPKWFPEWFTYTKKASERELRSIYSRSSVYVCATKNEGFGLTCLEAMACGCCVVSTDYPGIKDYAVHNVNSILSPVGDVDKLADNIILALHDNELRKRLSASAVKTARRSSWDNCAQELNQILRENANE